MKRAFGELKSVDREPLLFTLARRIQAAGLRGGYRLEKTLRNRGDLDVNVRRELPNGVAVYVPLAERAHDAQYLADYESDSIEQMARIVGGYGTTFCLLDCGADIGVMSAKFVSSIPEIVKVVSFEPNAVSYEYLECNSRLLGVDAKALNMGVGDFNGKAELQWPEFSTHDHAAYVVPSEEGSFEVTTIDELGLKGEKALFFKIDVEGGELAVLRGAKESIESADHVVVLFEAHPDQVRRTGVDPVEIIAFVTSIRECEATVMESPGEGIDPSRPFFDQFPDQIFNICLHSSTRTVEDAPPPSGVSPAHAQRPGAHHPSQSSSRAVRTPPRSPTAPLA